MSHTASVLLAAGALFAYAALGWRSRADRERRASKQDPTGCWVILGVPAGLLLAGALFAVNPQFWLTRAVGDDSFTHYAADGSLVVEDGFWPALGVFVAVVLLSGWIADRWPRIGFIIMAIWTMLIALATVGTVGELWYG